MRRAFLIAAATLSLVEPAAAFPDAYLCATESEIVVNYDAKTGELVPLKMGAGEQYVFRRTKPDDVKSGGDSDYVWGLFSLNTKTPWSRCDRDFAPGLYPPREVLFCQGTWNVTFNMRTLHFQAIFDGGYGGYARAPAGREGEEPMVIQVGKCSPITSRF